MTKLLERKTRTRTASSEEAIHESVRRRLDGCPYRFVFNKVTCHFADGQLTLRGSVPSFYLKQLLLEMMRGIQSVERIVNDVDVVSATGLSSEHRAKPR